MRNILALVFILSVTACGGGGEATVPPVSPPVTPPVTPLPATPVDESELYEPLVPSYTGLKSDYYINRSNVAETALNIFYSLDFINSLTFGDVADRYLFIETERQPVAFDDETLVCESGSTSFDTDEALRRVEVKYNRCVTNGVRLNGVVRAALSVTEEEKLPWTAIVTKQALAWVNDGCPYN